MAKRLVKHSMRKIVDTYSAKLVRSTAISSSATTNSSSNSNIQGTQQFSNPLDGPFTISSGKVVSESLHYGPALFLKRKISTKVEKMRKKEPPKTEKKSENPQKPKSPKYNRNLKIPESKFSKPEKIPQKPESKFSEPGKNPKKLKSKFAEPEKNPNKHESKFLEPEFFSEKPKSMLSEPEQNPKKPKSKLPEPEKNFKNSKSKVSEPEIFFEKPESKLSESVKNPKTPKIPENPETKLSEAEKKTQSSESTFSESEKHTKHPQNPEMPESMLSESEKNPQNVESKLIESEKKTRNLKKLEKSESKLSDSEKLCSILNGDVALEDVVDKLEETAIEMNACLLDEVIRKSDNAGRKALVFYKWAVQQPGIRPDLDSFNAVIDYFGRKNDFKAVESLLKENVKGLKVDLKTFEMVVKSLVKAGREKKTVEFFHKMGEHGFKQDVKAQKIVVRELCDAGFASYAEKLVKEKADVYYPDEEICNRLVKGWCVAGKLNEARRMVKEMSVGRFAMDAMAYNALLDCVCKLCIEKDPFRLMTEAKEILLQMEAAGVPRNEVTFNVLITRLCQIRKTSDAMKLFEEMEGYGCSPNLKIYVVLIRSLFLAARVAEGHEMLEKMKEAGFKAVERDYFEFIKVLCNIHRVEHAHIVFHTMKGNGCLPGIETYELLIRKLFVAGYADKAQKLFNEAVERQLILSNRTDLLEQSKVEEPEQKIKKKTKKLTLKLKRKEKNLKLKKIRLSFVKKPRKPKMM